MIGFPHVYTIRSENEAHQVSRLQRGAEVDGNILIGSSATLLTLRLSPSGRFISRREKTARKRINSIATPWPASIRLAITDHIKIHSYG